MVLHTHSQSTIRPCFSRSQASQWTGLTLHFANEVIKSTAIWAPHSRHAHLALAQPHHFQGKTQEVRLTEAQPTWFDTNWTWQLAFTHLHVDCLKNAITGM